MSQRERVAETRRLVLEILKQVIERKASKLGAKGFVYVSSREIYGHCLEELGNDENKCVGVATYAARLLNSYAIRIDSYRPKWRITTDLLRKLFSIDESYEDLKDIPLHRLSNIQFLYVVASLLYEAKAVEGDSDGNGG
jgi:hypothetical protein